jgi:apolipoprotein N-acyltransferase
LRGLPRRELLAALSGALLALSFPKFGRGFVAWIALAPLLISLHGVSASRALRLGYVTGAVSSLGLLYWTSSVVIAFGGLSLPVGIGVMALLCLAVALFPSLFAWLVGRWLAAFGPAALLLAPVAWVGSEILRAYTFFRFPWCLLGYSQHANLPMIQVARFTAVYGVSFLVVASGSVLAYVAVERSAARRRAAALALAALMAAVWLDGSTQLSRPVAASGSVRVGLVQASILQEEKWDETRAAENLARHEALTVQAASQGARLVVWPESSVPFYYDRAPDLAEELRSLARLHGAYLLFGNDDREDGAGSYRVWVGAKMLTPAGELAYRYHKIRLVPFGEYVPMQGLLTFGGRIAAKLVQQVADFTPGDEYSVAPIEGHKLAATICYEAIFPDLLREFPVRGAELLVNITNDGWYGRSSAPYQHFSMAVFRAVENGRYLVRAANTGITAVVDPRGRVLAQTSLFERTVLVRDVPFVSALTFYSRHGDLFGWGCLAAACALTLGTGLPSGSRLRARRR